MNQHWLTPEDIERVLARTFPDIKVTVEYEDDLGNVAHALEDVEATANPVPTYLLSNGVTIRQVEMEVTRHSILGHKVEILPGWQASVTVSSGGSRWDPPDVDEADLGEPHENLVSAIAAAAGALVQDAVAEALSDVWLAKSLKDEADYVAAHAADYADNDITDVPY